MEENIIRADYDEQGVIVYQAYSMDIAIPAVKAQTFVPPFKAQRMTWIKPSFLWMMYRSGWARKENQECVLRIRIHHDGFHWALRNSCISHFDETSGMTMEQWQAELLSKPVRIQWDPEKDIHLNNLSHRSIQVGLKGEAVLRYIKEWILSIEDISPLCRNIEDLILQGNIAEAKGLLPQERNYVSADHSRKIGRAHV